MKSRSLFVLTILLVSASSLAQETPPQPQPKSPGKALAWSLWGTVLPYAAGTTLQLSTTNDATEIMGASLANSGIVFGPSLGYYYGGLSDRALRGNIIRGTLCAIFIVAVLESERQGDAAEDVAAVASLGLIIHAVVDIAQSDGAVRKRNAKLQETGWLLTPKYFAGHQAGGLELQLGF